MTDKIKSNIKNFAAKPELIYVELDDPELMAKYDDECITFYTYSIVSLEKYFDFFNARTDADYGNLGKMMRSLILDEKGNKVLAEDEDLPIDIAAAAINKIGEILGKSQSSVSVKETGKQQS